MFRNENKNKNIKKIIENDVEIFFITGIEF